MKHLLRVVFLLISSLLIQPSAAYDVSGSTLQEVGSALQSPPGSVTTSWNSPIRPLLNPSYCKKEKKYVVEAKTVSGTGVVNQSMDVKLPHWTDQSAASAAAQAEWERFLAALTSHENGHVSISEKFLKDNREAIEKELAAIQVQAAGDTQAEAESKAEDAFHAIARSIINSYFKKLVALQEKYDKQTKHGQTQGALLDISIE